MITRSGALIGNLRDYRSGRSPTIANTGACVPSLCTCDTLDDRTLVLVMVNGIGANLTNDEKRAHLIDLRREHLIEQVCIQEILPPES